LPPRVFGVPALVVMAIGVYSMSTLPAEPDFFAAFWRLAIVGLGVGATFPAVSIGSMGAIRGQELGLGSGIVNTARQVGFAIGIALFVAVFTGAVDNHVQEAAQRARAEQPNAPLVKREVGGEQITVVSGEKADRILHEELRDAYGAPFRVGAFVILLAIPFSWTMRKKPSDVQREEAAGGVAAAAAA
jgi:hypothetical protein